MRVTQIAAPVRHQAANAIRDAIVSGELLPGERLRERELCEQVGVSRATLREAYSQLESEGFISVTPHKGPIVAAMDRNEARAVYEVREALECHGMHLFAERATDEQLGQLHSTVVALRSAHESGDVGRMLATKQTFYDVLYAGAGNHVLQSQASLLQARLWRLRAQSLGSPGRAHSSIEEIEKVLKALLRRNGAEAVRLWRAHIQHAAAAAFAETTDEDIDATPA